MQNKKMEDALSALQNKRFEVEPAANHQERFLQKLNAQRQKPAAKVIWLKPISVAASIVLILAIGLGFYSSYKAYEQPNYTQDALQLNSYFTSMLQVEVERLNQQQNNVDKSVIAETISELNALELEYKQLEKILNNNINPQIILHAMMENFQLRINLVRQVLEQIEQSQIDENQENSINA
jgi:hypothetical protein